MTEKKTIHRWFWVWDFEKEERWLNEMAAEGWVLDSVAYCTFRFVRCAPGEYIVRLEMRDADAGYLSLLSESGAEHIGHVLKWQYYRKKAVDGPFDLYSDLDSRIAHLDRIGKLILVLAVCNLVVGIFNSVHPVSTGWLNLLCVALLMYGLGRIHGKKEALESERQIRE